jgi:hypothetical protein
VDHVHAQALHAAQAFETINDQVRILLCDHHDRHLLALLGERGQEAALTLRPPQTQIFVTTVELMKLQVHAASSSCFFAAPQRRPRGL